MKRRFAWIARVRPERLADYRALHAAPWPEITALLQRASITNYSIFLHEPELLLFSYFEFVGNDFAEAMSELDSDPRAKAWHELTVACQVLPAGNDDAWTSLDEIFRLD